MLFEENEIRAIYKSSLICEEDITDSDFEAHLREFSEKLGYVVDSFGCDDQSSFLFGEQMVCGLNDVPYICFFHAIRRYFSGYEPDNVFMEGVFSEWEASFCEALAMLFYSISLEGMENTAGEITLPTMEWIEKAALPAAYDGRLFRYMALRYPVYGRQIIEFVYLQIHHIEEVIESVTSEYDRIKSLFFTKDPGRIKKVSGSSSDRHNGGKSVHTVIFEDDSRIVYKPHHAVIDKAFQGWVDELARTAGEAPFMFPKILDCTGGSFYGFVQAAPLEKREDAAEYFRRAGFLMGAVYLLKGNDLHAENMIACGREPVIIDTETIIAPRGCMLTRIAEKYYFYSINSMTLFPAMLALPGFREGEFAGLCNVFHGTANLPVYDGESIAGNAYADEICTGFESAVRTVVSDIGHFQDTVTKLFEGCPMRMVIRATASYMRILTGLCAKEPQSDIKCYRRLLNRKLFNVNEMLTEEECSAILSEEQKAFDRLDVPFFEEILDIRLLGSFSDEWKGIDDALIKNETDRIRFSLALIRPDARADTKLGVCSSDYSIEKNAKRLAERLLPLLSGHIHSIGVAREQRKFIISDIPVTAAALLEGNLGTLIALGAYRHVFGSLPTLDSEIQKSVDTLLDRVGSAHAITARETGLADGTAGYILGCGMCYDMGILSEDEYIRTLEMAGSVSDDELCLRYGETGLLYGNCGVLYAVSKVPQRFITDKLLLLRSRVWSNISSRQEYRDYTQERLTDEVKADMLRVYHGGRPAAESLIPCGNNSLRFGNAGMLYNAAEYLSRNDDKEIRTAADRLCGFLSAQEHIVCGTAVPDNCIETGILHGMPGVLYSICRYLRPDIIPSL